MNLSKFAKLNLPRKCLDLKLLFKQKWLFLSPGGLDEALNNILDMCHEQKVPSVFALGRRALGRACAKLVPVSVVGIFNYEGSEVRLQKIVY